MEDRRRQEQEQKKREAERKAADLLAAQVKSPAVVFAAGNTSRTKGRTSGTTGTSTPANVPLGENETYLRTAARPLEIDEAARMENPDRTLAQGSVIQAALQTAINSDLPGNVVAVVTEPVHAFFGDTVLIPRGSRLFGQYRSGIEINQKRILVLWTRILTPEIFGVFAVVMTLAPILVYAVVSEFQIHLLEIYGGRPGQGRCRCRS